MTPLIEQLPTEKLTAEEEIRLAARIRRGSRKAANTLVMATMREALLYTRRTGSNLIDDQERISLCYEKMMKIVGRFNPRKYKIRFFAFAKPALRGQMKTYWKTKDVVRNATEVISADYLGGWTTKGHTHKPPWEWSRNNPRLPFSPEDDKVESFREGITGEVCQPDTDLICARDRWNEIEKLIKGRLTEKQRQVLILTYKSGLSFPEIGKLMDVTRSMVHSIHREAIKIIRDRVARDGRLLTE